MKELRKRIPTQLRLATDLAAIGLLLFLIWAFLGYPAFTANQAFRRGLKNAAYPDTELGVLLEDPSNEGYYYGIGGNDTYAYRVRLSKDKGWKPEHVEICTSQAAQSVWCLRIPWALCYECVKDYDHVGYIGHYYAMTTQNSKPLYDAATGEALRIPCFAVKAPGNTASLTLVLEDGDYINPFTGESEHSNRTEWSLPELEVRDGWFVFGFNPREIYEATQNEAYLKNLVFDEPYHSYFMWIEQYKSIGSKPEYCPAAHLELTTYDEAGNELRTEFLPLDGE